MQLEVGAVSAVYGSHQCAVVLRVGQAQSMADLMSRHNPQAEALALPLRPQFIRIKVHDAGLWGISVG